MGRTKKIKKQISDGEYQHILVKLKRGLHEVASQEELERMKLQIIKLYQVVKIIPSLQKFEPQRIDLLKTANLHLQFINLDNDIWSLYSNGDIQGAYDLAINGAGMMNSHPDRHLLQDWVRNTLQRTLGKIAEIASSRAEDTPEKPKVSDEKAGKSQLIHSFPNQDPILPKLDGKTIRKSPEMDISAHNTIIPGKNDTKLDSYSSKRGETVPFPKPDPNSVGIKSREQANARKISEADDFETLFNPTTYLPPTDKSPSSNPFETPPGEMPSNESSTNPIQTYWVRNQNLKDHIEKNSDLLKKGQKSDSSKKSTE